MRLSGVVQGMAIEKRVRVTFKILFFWTGRYESDVLFFFFFIFFFCVRQKSLHLIFFFLNIELCQYKNISLPQYCVTRWHLVFTGAFDQLTRNRWFASIP